MQISNIFRKSPLQVAHGALDTAVASYGALAGGATDTFIGGYAKPAGALSAFALHGGLVQAGGVKSHGTGCGHLHGDIFDQFLHFGPGGAFGLAAGQKHQHADLAVGVDVLADDGAFAGLGVAGKLADLHVFAHRGDKLGHFFTHQGFKGHGVGRGVVQHGLGQLGGHVLELIAAGTAIDYDGATGVQFLDNGDSTGTYSEDEVKDGKFESVGIR